MLTRAGFWRHDVMRMWIKLKVDGIDEQCKEAWVIVLSSEALSLKLFTTAATTTTTTRPKDRGVVVQEPSEFRVPQETQPSSSKDKGKAKLDAELLEEQKLARKQEEEANIALIESWENTQAMMEADRLLAERLQSKEREDIDR
ncbi:hypothetical protein Tco_0611774 [Tanacetum coccineum]